MGRRNAVPGARRSQSGPLSHVHSNEPLPVSVPDYFRFLSAKEHDGSGRPVKRQKTEAGVESITIIREQLVISRPNDQPLSDTHPFRVHDAQSYLRFQLTESEPVAKPAHTYILTISTRSSSKAGGFCVAFPLKAKDVSDNLAAVLNSRDTSWSNPGTEDFIWIAADAQLDSNADTIKISFDFLVKWNVSTTVYPMSFSSYQRKFRQGMLAIAFPGIFDFAPGSQGNSCSPQLFYDAAHVPDPDSTPPEDLTIPQLTANLYPFQRRAVQWMLQREGVQWTRNRNDSDSDVNEIGFGRFDAPSSFTEIRDADARVCYISRLLGKITRDPSPFELLEQNTKGGILSEEMGLGKTVELLALCLLHRRPVGSAEETFDPYLGEQVKATPATLIVAPVSLRKQWLSELSKHAPGLRVMLYSGLNQEAREDQSNERALIEELSNQDVVVTTYNVLTSELDYALGEPDRARRQPRKYHRPRSPLTQLSWWRVCLDEAQMIESGVSKAATLARLLPRVNAWGVTGTPVKDSVEDLRGLLLFLRYEPFASNIQAWNSLINSDPEGFRRLFDQLALRHSKRLVRHEIFIPAQKRYVITMPFTAVEEQHYQSLFQEVVEACGLTTKGEPMRDDWDPEDPGVLEKMRTALDRLRQTALHPEVGQRNRRALGRRNGPMRTVTEVLDVMIEQSEVSMRTDQRALLVAKLTKGQLLENSPRVRTALKIWQGVLEAANNIVDECRKNLQHEVEQARNSTSDRDNATTEATSDDEVDEIEAGRVGDARRRLRSALEIQHKAAFFCANAHFQIKSNEEMTKPDSDDFHRLEKLEVEGYDSAKKIRREILDDIRRKALKLMAKITGAASKQSFAVIPELKSMDSRGIESRTIVESFEELAGFLNEQADKLDDWRERIIQLLLKQLVDDDETEITGDEYEDSTKLMEEIVVYIQILRTAIADREDAMSGQINQLVKHEAKIALELANDGDGPYPEKLIELFAERKQVKPPKDLRSPRAVVSELRALSVKLRHDAATGSQRARLELDIVSEQLKSIQKQLVDQQKIAQAMNQELDLFTATMNARVEFYRQLQYLSDMVAPYEGPTGDNVMNRLLAEEETLASKLEASQAKHRYLLHLKDMDAKDGDQRMCIICRENFTIGVLTICGHQFCKECITLWFKANHNCPVCKKRLHNSSLHDITLKPQELKMHSDSTGTSPKKLTENRIRSSPATSRTSAIYKEFSEEKLAEIKNVDLDGPAFTTKVDNLVRHLLWLRDSDPGSKSIIFSQYSDFLNVLRLAFKRYRIGFTSFDKTNGATEFKEDPSIECFLLHARAHASGLNLVNASHVFLCEPLINTALELQAIARVHRIGQEQETTVWLYIVDGTVEESIYNLSVRRRMEHMKGDHTRAVARARAPAGGGRHVDKGKSTRESTPELADEAIEAANSIELEHASLSKLMGKGKAAGEAVDKGDLWECLFGHVAQGRRASRGGVAGEPGPAIRGLLAAEAAERRKEEEEDGEGEGPLRLVNGL